METEQAGNGSAQSVSGPSAPAMTGSESAHCSLCRAKFANPEMARFHYSGRWHTMNTEREKQGLPALNKGKALTVIKHAGKDSPQKTGPESDNSGQGPEKVGQGFGNGTGSGARGPGPRPGMQMQRMKYFPGMGMGMGPRFMGPQMMGPQMMGPMGMGMGPGMAPMGMGPMGMGMMPLGMGTGMPAPEGAFADDSLYAFLSSTDFQYFQKHVAF